MKKSHKFIIYPIEKNIEVGDLVTFKLRMNDKIETIIGLVYVVIDEFHVAVYYCDRVSIKLNRIGLRKDELTNQQLVVLDNKTNTNQGEYALFIDENKPRIIYAQEIEGGYVSIGSQMALPLEYLRPIISMYPQADTWFSKINNLPLVSRKFIEEWINTSNPLDLVVNVTHEDDLDNNVRIYMDNTINCCIDYESLEYGINFEVKQESDVIAEQHDKSLEVETHNNQDMYNDEEVKFIATRFRHACSLKDINTNLYTCTYFDEWFEEFKKKLKK